MKDRQLIIKIKRDDFLADLVFDLVKRRRQLQVSQDNLNWKLGVTSKLVAKWECGIRTPSAYSLFCWADALDCRLALKPLAANDNWNVANDNLK